MAKSMEVVETKRKISNEEPEILKFEDKESLIECLFFMTY